MERAMKRVLATACMVLTAGTLSAAPRIVDMSLKGGAKGLMLVVTADAAYPPDVETQVKPLSPTTARVTVTTRGAGYGLGVHRFTDMPAGCPVSEISARVQEGYEVVEITLQLHVPSPGDMAAKVKGRELLVLLSPERMSPLAWRASSGQQAGTGAGAAVPPAATVQPEPVTAAAHAAVAAPSQAPARPASASVPSAAQPELACLRDIIVVERGGVAQLHLALTGESAPRVRYEADRVILLFPRVANCMAEHRLEPPVGRVFRSIELKQRTHDGAEWLGAIVTLAPGERSPLLVRSEPGRTTLAAVMRDEAYAVWTARGGQSASADFVRQAPAVAVASSPAPGPVSAPSEPVAVAAPEQVQSYCVTTGSRVNVRSAPTTAEQNIVGTLPRGATVGVVEVQGDWRRVTAEGGKRGWVLASLLAPQTAGGEPAPEPAVAAPAPQAVKAAGMLPSIGAIASMAARAQAPGSPAPAAALQPLPPGTAPAVAAAPPAAPADSMAAPRTGLVQYTILGRDPFLPHVRRIDDALPSVENLKLVGVLYDRADRIALLQDELFGEKSYALREQEAVNSGVVWRINPSSVVFLITELGVSRAYTLELGDVSPTKVQSKRGK